jgi:glycosyltransferase involved in cell wall biosynthesis
VLLVDLAKGYGGPESRVLSLASALQDSVERCAVAVTSGSPLHQRLLSDGIPCEPVSAGRSNPRLVLELSRTVRRGGYQVVDAHNIQSIFWGHLAALLGGARGRVTTVHSDYGQEYSGVRRALYPAVFQLLRPITRHFVQVTEPLQEIAELKGDGSRSTLIHNSVAVAEHPTSAKDLALIAEWGWAPSDFLVAVVGRLFEVKGQAYLVDAIAELRDLPHIKLVVVGDGPQLGELRGRVASLGVDERVRFLGFRSDVPRLLATVDCVCLPSLWELLPYAALEAAAQALPIVATAVGGVPHLLKDQETALLVPPANAAALAAGIRTLAEDPEGARRLGQAAYEMVRASFGIEKMLAETLRVYRRSLA